MKKRVLFFAPRTFGFYRHIIKAMKHNGYEVDFFNELWSTPFQTFNKVLLKFPLRANVFFQKKYINFLLKRRIFHNLNYDYVFIIRGEFFSPDVISILKRHTSNSEYILYQWDSSANLRFFSEQIAWFDKVYTFDESDAKYFNVKHKSLFFNSSHVKKRSKSSASFSVSFVGTHHSNRFSFIKQFFDENPELKSNAIIRLLRPWTSFLRAMILNRGELEGASLSDFITRPVSEEETLEIFSSSEHILDITQPGQVGLTLRSFEALGLQKKLITTNSGVKNYDFYDPRNIFLIDEANLRVSKSFLQGGYHPVPECILKRYHVNFWVQEFFDDNH